VSVHGDICEILNDADVADGDAHPEFLDSDSEATEYVIVRRTNTEPQMTLIGYGGLTRDTFLFECWSTGKAGAIAIAEAVIAAMDEAAAIGLSDSPPLYLMQREAPAASEDFTPDVMAIMEPVQYSIWRP
jgi:hypothetical protein